MQEAIVPEIYDEKLIDISINIESEKAFTSARRVMKKTEISVGMSSGAAINAVEQLSKNISHKNCIVIIFPDGAEKYVSTALFKQ